MYGRRGFTGSEEVLPLMWASGLNGISLKSKAASMDTLGNWVPPVDELRDSLVTKWKMLSSSSLGQESNASSSLAEKGVLLKWKDLSVSVDLGKNRWKPILRGVNGSATPGQLLAIMGSSGAGKSTLLNTLAGQLGKEYRVQGTIRAKHIQEDWGHSSDGTTFGYVHQNEIYFETLTVEEHLSFIAALRLNDLCEKDRRQRVEDQISNMGLEKCKSTRITSTLKSKGISGGEKKRLSFASASIHFPHLFLADEPTSGLDASSAMDAVTAMKSMTKTTIICTIHQPASEVFYMFDKLMLLAEGGMVAFFGSPSQCIKFLDSQGIHCPFNYNPADVYVEAISVDPFNPDKSLNFIKNICNEFERSKGHQMPWRDIDDYLARDFFLELGGKAPIITEIAWLTYRAFLEGIRKKSAHTNRIFQRLFVAIVIAVVFSKLDISHADQSTINNVSGIFIIFLSECSLPIEFGYIYEFPNDLPAVRREVADGMYRAPNYYVGKVLASFPILLFDVSLINAVFYFATGLGGFNGYCLTTLVAFSCSCISAAFGILLSMCFSSVANAATTGGFFNAVLFSFSGFYINFRTLPHWLVWIRYIDWFSYSFALLLTWHWGGIEHISCDFPDKQSCLRTGEDVLESYALPRTRYISPFDFVNLAVLFVAFHTVAFILYMKRIKHLA